jgi:hypothetical protein
MVGNKKPAEQETQMKTPMNRLIRLTEKMIRLGPGNDKVGAKT